ncbi:hypothetical protein CABS01_16442 [Colletotrichum abscissum]|uniref:uncharacterized protein n=1 Tax=Colletotrichum abscissum TaxID=1671311 RepID=UPI0027D72167|nr:uncharacterized protein CABS01_16442 [Colletotrichum abscissum]KAK1471180.1 hypothetical protein CABS01_16442 [Colletotrichum abscissum]
MLVPSAEETEAGYDANATDSSYATAEASSGRFWRQHEAPPFRVTTAPLPAGAWLNPATTPGTVPGPVIYSNQVNNGGNQYNGDVRIDYGPPETLKGNRSLDAVSSPNNELDIPSLPKFALDAEDATSRDREFDYSGDTRVENEGKRNTLTSAHSDLISPARWEQLVAVTNSSLVFSGNKVFGWEQRIFRDTTQNEN